MRMMVLYKKVDPCHSKKHKHGIGPSVLRETDMIGHESKGKGTGEGDIRRKQSRQKVNHGYGKSSKDQRDNPQIFFRFFKRVEEMGENKKERRVEESRVFLIEFNLAVEVIPRIIVRVDFIHPEGFSVKGVKSQGESYKETEKDNKDFFSL